MFQQFFFLLSGSGARNIKVHSVCSPTEAQVRIYLYLFINGTILLSFVCNSQKCICMNTNSVFHLLERKSQPSEWNCCWTEYELPGAHNALRYSMHGFLMSHLWRSQFRYTMKRQLRLSGLKTSPGYTMAALQACPKWHFVSMCDKKSEATAHTGEPLRENEDISILKTFSR